MLLKRVFELTHKEAERVKVAKFLGIKLDPISYLDMSTIIVIGLNYLIQLAAFVYLIRNRNYPPLKVKNIPLTCSLFFCGLAWFLGDLFTGGFVHLYETPILQSCKLTVIWFRACLGAYSVTSVFALRVYSLYRVFHKGKPYKGRMVYLSIGLTLLSIILFAVISTLVPARLTTQYEKILDMCYTTHSYIIAVLSVIWSIWLFTAVMSWKLRNISFCFNEKIEIFTAFILLLIVSVMNTICLLYVKVYPAYAVWRTSLIYVDHGCATFGFWVIMWEPTYQCIFHREEYLRFWVETLHEDNMDRLYLCTEDVLCDTTVDHQLTPRPHPHPHSHPRSHPHPLLPCATASHGEVAGGKRDSLTAKSCCDSPGNHSDGETCHVSTPTTLGIYINKKGTDTKHQTIHSPFDAKIFTF